MTRHLFVHGIGERFKCDKCNKPFSQKCHLRTHQKSHYLLSNKKCNQCGKLYKTDRILKIHIQDIHSEKHLKCDQCVKMFSTNLRMKRHKKQVHILNSFKCYECKYRTKTMRNLKNHITTVHDGVRDKSANCDLCDFRGKDINLKIHKESVHENKKNWFCKACPYSTYLRSNFQTHMRIHTGEKPFQCKTCHKYFTYHSNANAHCKSWRNSYYNKLKKCKYSAYAVIMNLIKITNLRLGIKLKFENIFCFKIDFNWNFLYLVFRAIVFWKYIWIHLCLCLVIWLFRM